MHDSLSLSRNDMFSTFWQIMWLYRAEFCGRQFGITTMEHKQIKKEAR